MEVALSLVVGAVFTAGSWLLLQRDFFRAVLGIALLGTGTNLLVFTAAGPTRSAPPLLGDGAIATAVADPLPQALVLTAIVIGFGLFAFAMALALRRRPAAPAASSDAQAPEAARWPAASRPRSRRAAG